MWKERKWATFADTVLSISSFSGFLASVLTETIHKVQRMFLNTSEGVPFSKDMQERTKNCLKCF